MAPEIERTASRPDAPTLLVTKLRPPFVPPQAIVRERLDIARRFRWLPIGEAVDLAA